MAHRHFIGSSYVGPAQGAITLRGEIDSSAVDQLAVHLDAFLAAAVRVLTVDASGVRSCDPRVLDLLGQTQRRLDRRGGSITLTGLHPSMLLAPTLTAPVPIGAEVWTPQPS